MTTQESFIALSTACKHLKGAIIHAVRMNRLYKLMGEWAKERKK